MPIADLQQYLLYAERQKLPSVRLELLLAQLALVLAEVHGSQNLRLTDFLRVVSPPSDEQEEPEADPEQAAEQVAAFFGYKPRKRRATHNEPNRDTHDGQQPGQPGRIAGP